MKNILFILLLLPALAFCQSAPQPALYEVVNLKIKKGQEKAFEAAVKKHNAEFHAAGSLHKANVHFIINGPDGGKYSWVMGPTNFTAMDNRPGEGAHDDDWAKVADFIESADVPDYWSEDAELSFMGTNTSNGKSMVWVYDLEEGKGRKWMGLMLKIKEVYKTKYPKESFYVYWNEFVNTKEGNDAAIVFPFKKWAWLDDNSKFYENYEAVHGEETWGLFLSELRDCVNGRVDFLRELID